jgi:hypothetical protein
MLQTDTRELEALYPTLTDCLPASWLGERLAVGSERLADWRRQGRVFAIDVPAAVAPCGPLYPVWQFDINARRPLPRLDWVLAEAEKQGLDAVAFYQAMTKRGGLTVKGAQPYRYLAAGETSLPLDAIRWVAAAKLRRAALALELAARPKVTASPVEALVEPVAEPAAEVAEEVAVTAPPTPSPIGVSLFLVPTRRRSQATIPTSLPESLPEAAAAGPRAERHLLTPRQWGITELESLKAREPEAGRIEEMGFLIDSLREHADSRGQLPVNFDALVQQSFGHLL